MGDKIGKQQYRILALEIYALDFASFLVKKSKTTMFADCIAGRLYYY
jgi:hypothetical protein